MKKYCKAYYLKDVRQFEGWTETCGQEEPELTDETIVYLWDDLTVVRSPVVPEKGVLWNRATPEWRQFCQTTLHFEIPKDLGYAYEQAQEGSERTDPGGS